MTLRERFLAKTTQGDGCWTWRGATDGRGYGQMQLGRVSRGGHRSPTKAHRVAYELFVGPIPEGLQLDHLCRNTLCVNPAHLEPVTNRENTVRAIDPTRCRNGHERTPANTYLRADGRRECRLCKNVRDRAAWPVAAARRRVRLYSDPAYGLKRGRRRGV